MTPAQRHRDSPDDSVARAPDAPQEAVLGAPAEVCRERLWLRHNGLGLCDSLSRKRPSGQLAVVNPGAQSARSGS